MGARPCSGAQLVDGYRAAFSLHEQSRAANSVSPRTPSPRCPSSSITRRALFDIQLEGSEPDSRHMGRECSVQRGGIEFHQARSRGMPSRICSTEKSPLAVVFRRSGGEERYRNRSEHGGSPRAPSPPSPRSKHAKRRGRPWDRPNRKLPPHWDGCEPPAGSIAYSLRRIDRPGRANK